MAVQYPDQNGLKVYQFHYLDNLWHEFELPVDVMGRQAIGAGNGCIFGAYGYDNSTSVRLMTFYSDESHEWHTGCAVDVPACVNWDDEISFPVWTVRTYMHMAVISSLEWRNRRTELSGFWQ